MAAAVTTAQDGHKLLNVESGAELADGRQLTTSTYVTRLLENPAAAPEPKRPSHPKSNVYFCPANLAHWMIGRLIYEMNGLLLFRQFNGGGRGFEFPMIQISVSVSRTLPRFPSPTDCRRIPQPKEISMSASSFIEKVLN